MRVFAREYSLGERRVASDFSFTLHSRLWYVMFTLLVDLLRVKVDKLLTLEG